MNDIILGKAEVIERAIARVRETYGKWGGELEHNYDAQDIILPNLQRMCEAAIDLAMHIVRKNNLGLPKDSRDAFTLIERAGVIAAPHAEALRKMVSFRNICVHDYRSIEWTIVRSLIDHSRKCFPS